MITGENIEGYLEGYSDGYKAGVQYALDTIRDLMGKAGMFSSEPDSAAKSEKEL